MVRKRIFYLDFIRAIAVLLIVLTHYNAIFVFLGDEKLLNKVVLAWKIANLYMGDFGVSLFLIISGAALMYVYDAELKLKDFYKKRFLCIYPMFWTAYFIAFMYSFWRMKGIDQTIPKMSIIWSILGMDGYLTGIVPTFYKVGEWFLGFIIIFYIVFPILRIGVISYPKLTCIIILGIYFFANSYYQLPLNKSIFLFIRLPEIVFGMYFVKYVKYSNWKLALVGGVVLVVNIIVQPQINKDLQTTYVGIAAFLLLSYIGELLEDRRIIQTICKILSKYSYAIFLTHHFIIQEITQRYDLYDITVLESYLLFIFCCCVIAFFSKGLYELDKCIRLNIRKIYQ